MVLRLLIKSHIVDFSTAILMPFKLLIRPKIQMNDNIISSVHREIELICISNPTNVPESDLKRAAAEMQCFHAADVNPKQ